MIQVSGHVADAFILLLGLGDFLKGTNQQSSYYKL